jgi:5-methyltetrahydrofolate--homocysteine methyltransferase
MSLQTGLELVAKLHCGVKMLADGAVGSELIRWGIAPERTVDANLIAPERVRDLHRRAIAAGADLITANTFGLPGDTTWADAFQAGVSLAETEAQSASREVGVMVSVYPAELLQNPRVVLQSFYGSASGRNVLLIETAVALREAVEAVGTAARSGVAVIAATCHFQPDGTMPDGTTPEQAVAALQQAGAAIVGANCGAVPEDLFPVAERMRAVAQTPLLFQPNAGLPKRVGDDWIYPVDPERFAAGAARLYESGVSIVGGCCGTTPAHIAAAKRLFFHPQRRE